MSFLHPHNKPKFERLSRGLFTSAAVSAMSAIMLINVAPTASAQVVIDVTDCVDLESGTFDNPGVDGEGATVNIDVNDECTLASGDIVDLENDQQDNVVINIAAGTTLTNTDSSDEDVVIFVDNSEDRVEINIEAGATLNGDNGVIFLEGDGARLYNEGSIIGTGTAEEGVLYIDRDTDSDRNYINNLGNGEIIAQADGPAIGIEVLIADSFDDAVDVGVQNDFADFPDIRIFNDENATIASQGTSTGDDNDGINVAANPGDTGGIARTCIESGTLNCIVNLRIVNEGTISSVANSSSNAAITIEDDAIFNGEIRNLATGVITGTRNGIRIGDIVVGGQTAEHGAADGSESLISNFGVISGTGTSSRGIDLEGDNIRIENRAGATISGVSVGVEVGAGQTSSVDNSGLNNVIRNSGTISGGNYAVDSTAAEGLVRLISEGGSFDGRIRGSLGNLDVLFIRKGTTTLTHDVLQNYRVNVATTGNLIFEGDRTIEGDLNGRGTLTFDLSDTQTVTGDVFLRGTSTVALTDMSDIASLGQDYTLLQVGGLLVNNSTLDASAITDNSMLIDFEFDTEATDLVVVAVAAGGAVKPSVKVSRYLDDIQFGDVSSESFGGTVLTAFVDGGLNNTAAFSNLAGISTATDVGIALNSLAPNFGGTLVKNVSNTIQGGAEQIDHRLSDLNCHTFFDVRETASLGADNGESCQPFGETGAWVQSSRPHATGGSLSLNAPTFFNNGFDQDNITMTYGFDQAVDDSTIVGLSGSYTESEIDEDSYAVSSTELDVVQFAAYAGHRVGNAQFVTKASYAHGEAETHRQSFDVIKSQVDINALNVQSVASYNVNLGQGFYLKPEAGFHYNNISTGSYAESGGLNLNVDEVNSNVLDGRVGLTLGARKVISDATKADVYITGALRQDVYGNRDDIGFNFAGQSGSLAVANVDKFAVQALAGINLLSGENFSFGGAVNSEFSDSENSVGGSLQTKVRW